MLLQVSTEKNVPEQIQMETHGKESKEVLGFGEGTIKVVDVDV